MKSKRGARFLVFMSHATDDRWIARQICRLLEEKGAVCGIETFLDEKSIDYGCSIPDSIRDNIMKCDEFLVLLTHRSIARPWILVETGAAWGLKKRITAIIDKVAVNEMPDILVPYKAVDLNDVDEFLNQIVERAERQGKR